MIARVFPSKTSLTPDDDYAFVGDPPLLLPDDITEVHVSVVFTWDIDEGKRLQYAWEKRLGVPTLIGGPALGTHAEGFTPGLYIKKGVTFTSRGCPNRCWFCSVWKRQPEGLVELPIGDGWIVQDDNLLACSRRHIEAVFSMLDKQPHAAEFMGLEPKLLEPWHIDLLRGMKRKPKIWLAYDTPDDLPHLIRAVKLLSPHFSRNYVYCYVLIGHPKDTFEAAEERLELVKSLGICPFAMLYKNDAGEDRGKMWRKFQRMWCRPAAIFAKNWVSPLEIVRGARGGCIDKF